MFIVLMAGGGAGGAFLAGTGLKIAGRVVKVGLGACFEAAKAYDGVDVVFLVDLKLKLEEGAVTTRSILSIALASCSSLASMTSGTLHPKVLAPARALSTR